MKALLLLGFALLAQETLKEGDLLERAPSEGALDNDVFVDVSPPAAEALVRGDAELAEARAATARGDEAEAARRLARAFEEWRTALVVGGPGALVWSDPARREPGRLAEGVPTVIERRLAALVREERSAWSDRFALSAASALASAGLDEAGLAEVVRLHPLTAAAGQAALRLCDLALESGRRQLGRAWLERAALDLELARVPAAAAALAARRTVLGPPGRGAREAWERAPTFELGGFLEWQDQGRRRATRKRPAPERSSPPGAAFLGADELVVQTPEELFTLSLDAAGAPAWEERQRLADLLEGPGGFLEHDETGPWPLLPLWTGESLVLIVGHSRSEPNALVVLERQGPASPSKLGLSLSEDLGLTRAPTAFHLAWAVIDDERLVPDSESVPVAGLEGLEPLEYQPGPVLCGDLLLVQARETVGQVRAWLLAFDPRAGTLVYKRLLASGADRAPTERFALTAPRLASQALLGLDQNGEALVFAGTHLGAGALIEARSGEFRWLFKNRRHPPRERGWTGDRPLLATRRAGSGPEGGAALLWAPSDSDHLYLLEVAGPAPGLPEDLALSGGRPAIPQATAEALVGGDANEAVLLTRSGKERTISARRPGQDGIEALDLGPDEAFSGRGLASPERVWVASERGVYLFDRRRELALLAFQTLPEPSAGGAAGGDLVASGKRVVVVGPAGLWSLVVP